MKRPLLLARVAAAIELAAPAHADNSTDAGFLAALDQAGITHSGANHAIAAGRAVCELMDQGLSPMHTVNAVRSTEARYVAKAFARM